MFARRAAGFERACGTCCAAGGWVRQRVGASYRALHDYYNQRIQQITEELAAAEARRPAVIAARPAVHLDLPEPLQQQPPRLDMCRKCAGWIEQMELLEQSCRVHAENLQRQFQSRGMQAAPGAATASGAEAGAAAAAAGVPAREAQQGQQQQRQCGGVCGDVGNGSAPATPKQTPLSQHQPQHTSSGQELEQRQECNAADERHLLLSGAQRQQQAPQ